MRKVAIVVLAVAIVFGMSMGVMAENNDEFENNADIFQYGSSNFANIEQAFDNREGRDEVGDLEALIRQEGYENFAQQMMTSGAEADFEIKTWGSGNEAFQTLTDNYNPGGTEATIFQDGHDNLAFQEVAQPGNTVYAYQEGIANTVLQDISEGQASEQRAWQYGNENHISQTDTGQYNLSEIRQEGFDNTAVTVQSGGDWKANITNETFIEQEGSGNYAMTDQSGVENMATISQFGAENSATIIQDNNNLDEVNNASLYQEGNDNDASITQD